ncbi:uncharacterized protein PV06_02531 [Exophiala oligosperma]|uniref:Uncharacterized protein n=1 Tax=Exophiala oligosperma TaxID=215243 RepID=A0A0D2DWC3_9EURO|nr:uncharacterized protein PV06_02531 [Exophiala oligosperma]KIW46910.1 hypothetical protein PV06_02531 [Exophiala oligosperma]
MGISWQLTSVLGLLILWTILRLQIVNTAEVASLIFMFEWNLYKTRKRQRLAKDLNRDTSCVACAIGYNENPKDFRRCLQSYRSHGKSVKFFVLALDGTSTENQEMMDIFHEEFRTSGSNVLSFPDPLGVMVETEMKRRNQPNDAQNLQRQSQRALRHVCMRVAEMIDQQGDLATAQRSSPDTVPSLCILQPHSGIKEIRFAAWLVSKVIADKLGTPWIWSTDSDTSVLPDCIEMTVATLAGDDKAGAASSSVMIRSQPCSLLNLVYRSYFQAGVYTARAFCAANGSSTILTGPNTAYSVHALAQALLPWYLQTFQGAKVWANEDAHMATCLGQFGWKRLYVSNALVMIESPPSWTSWLMQMVRWQRAHHIERISSPGSIFTDDVFVFLWRFKELTILPLLFMANIKFAFTGQPLVSGYPTLFSGFLFSRAILGFYNIMRSFETQVNYIRWPFAVMVYIFTLPFAFVWSFLTIFVDFSSGNPRGNHPTEMQYIAFGIWTITTSITVVRVIYRGVHACL